MKKGKLMSFPQLRGAFEKVNAEAKKLLVGAHPAKVTGRFQEVWKKTFGKVISPKAAMAYLSMTKKGQHGGADPNIVGNYTPGAQMGGAVLSPAEASWDGGLTRPGAPFPPILNPQGVMTQAYQPMPGYPGANVPSSSFPNAASCSAALKGGRRTRRRGRGSRKQRGGAQYIPTPAEFVSSFAAHPYSSMNPPGAVGDLSRIFNGQAVAPPMDVTKSNPTYLPYSPGNMTLTNMAKFDGSQWLSSMGPR